MNKVYCFLLLVLLLGLGYAADLLSYIILDNDFFVFGVFVLGTLFVFSVFFFGTWLGTLFSLVFFSLTLLTGIISFRALVPENQALFGLLLLVGIFGFVGSLLWPSCDKAKKRFKPQRRDVPLPLPEFSFKPEEQAKESVRVSTYDLENSEPQSLTMESFDDLKDIEKDNDFIELQDVDRLMKAEKKAGKKGNGKKRDDKNKTYYSRSD